VVPARSGGKVAIMRNAGGGNRSEGSFKGVWF
jgi:hypothetical protein